MRVLTQVRPSVHVQMHDAAMRRLGLALAGPGEVARRDQCGRVLPLEELKGWLVM